MICRDMYMYIPVMVLLVCLKNRHHDFPGYSITFRRGGWERDQMFRYSRFSFTVMRNILLEFSFFLSLRYIIYFF